MPLTSASAVDTGGNGGKVRIYSQGTNPTTGVVEWSAGGAQVATAKLTASQTGSGGSLFAVQGGGVLGIRAPELDLNVEGLPVGGYGSVLRLSNATDATNYIGTKGGTTYVEGVPFGSLTGTGTQAVGSGAFSTLGLGVVRAVRGGMSYAAPGGLRVPQEGWYLVSGMIEFSANGTGRRLATIAVNGNVNAALQAQGSEQAVTTGASQHVAVPATPVHLLPTDLLTLVGYQDSGATINFQLSTSCLSAVYLGAY